MNILMSTMYMYLVLSGKYLFKYFRYVTACSMGYKNPFKVLPHYRHVDTIPQPVTLFYLAMGEP